MYFLLPLQQAAGMQSKPENKKVVSLNTLSSKACYPCHLTRKRLPYNSSPLTSKVQCYFRKLIGYVKSHTRLKRCYFLIFRLVFIRSRRKLKCRGKLSLLQCLGGKNLQNRYDCLRHIPTPAP